MPDGLELSVVAPCYNEAKNLPELAQRVKAVFARRDVRGELLLVDDGSTDDTRAVIDRLEAGDDEVRGVHHAENRGILAAWQSGLQRAEGEYVCLIDADLQYQPEDIARLLDEIRFSRADFVQGWRSEIGRKPDPRYYYSRVLNLMLNLLFGMRLRDNKSGFVLCRREVLEDVLRHRLRYRYFQSFIAVAAHRKGYTIRDIEVFFGQRLLGKSFISAFPLRIILGVISDLPKAFLEFRVFEQRNTVEQEFLDRHPPGEEREELAGWRRLLFRLFVASMPLHHWNIGWWAAAHYRNLNRTQWLSPGQIRELQDLKLRRLVHHAYHHVNYYREQFDRLGLRPSDIRTLSDLHKLPLLDKQTIRDNLYFNLMSDNHRKSRVCRIATSGSTGEPFAVFVDKTQLEMRWAATQRGMEWAGYRFGDRQARLWHQTLGLSRWQAFKERLAARLSRRLFIPAYEMTDETLPRIVRRLERFRPVLMDGYAESFNFLARYIKFRQLPDFRPRCIISSAQILPDESRKLIEQTFDCGVFDKYGSREFSGIAYECEAHQGKHVVAESYIVEILKDGRPAEPGETGEVVITDLNNFCMPFIRYRIGDLAVAMEPDSVCGCGRGLPRIGNIEGRVQAIILAANGRYLPGTFFAHFFKEYDYVVRQYQVVQEEQGAMRLRIVKALRFDDELFDEILERLRGYVGRETRIDVDFVEEIPLVRTGKHRESVSQLDLDFQKLPGKAVKL
jgi:phenylacetate-CoA ligase